MPAYLYQPVRTLLIDPRTERELGPQGVELILRHLWLESCQTCDRPLGARPPALVASAVGHHVELALHHPTCQAPRWEQDVIVDVSNTATFVYFPLLVPIEHPNTGIDEMIAAVLLNPGIERVDLHRDSGGRWQLCRWAGFGFTPLAQAAVWRHNPQARVLLGTPNPLTGDTEACIALGEDLPWRIGLRDAEVRQLRRHNGLFLIVTRTNPVNYDTAEEIQQLLDDLTRTNSADAVWLTPV